MPKRDLLQDDFYLRPYRLSDVIRLILALAIEKWSWKTDDKLTENLRDTPKSARTWIEVAKQHPEFFRINKDGSVVLLIRVLLQPSVPQGQSRKTLDVDQAIKITDQAIALHDKQLARYQRNSFRWPFFGAIMAAAFSLVIAIINIAYSVNNQKSQDKQFEKLFNKIDSVKYINALKH